MKTKKEEDRKFVQRASIERKDLISLKATFAVFLSRERKIELELRLSGKLIYRVRVGYQYTQDTAPSHEHQAADG